MRPGPPRVRRGGLCRGGGRCARTGRSTSTAAASPARCRGPALLPVGGAAQIVEATRASLAPVALPMQLRVVAAVPYHGVAAAAGAVNALRPAMLPHQGEALGVIDQRCEGDQVRCSHGDKRSCKGGELPSRFYHPGIFPPPPSFRPPSTPDPGKSQARTRSAGWPSRLRPTTTPRPGSSPACPTGHNIDTVGEFAGPEPLQEKLFAAWRQIGRKQDFCPDKHNHNAEYRLRLSPWSDFANSINIAAPRRPSACPSWESWCRR